MGLYAVQRGVCPGYGFHRPHHLRFEANHMVALSDDGEDEVRNLQLLCSCCNRAKATRGSHGFRMKMAELRAHNVAEGMMVDERLAVLTDRRLAQYPGKGTGGRSHGRCVHGGVSGHRRAWPAAWD